MGRMKDSSIGMSASMKPKHYGPDEKLIRPRILRFDRAKVRAFSVPGLGRIAHTFDRGEAELFSEHFLYTRLSAIVRDPKGRLIEQHDLGSGKVTDMGVLALANDWTWPIELAEPANTFSVCKYHAWGIGTGAEENFNYELETYSKPTAATESITGTAIGTNSLTFEKAGKNQKLVSTAKIKAAESLSITEWGLHSSAGPLKPATKEGAAGASTATTFKVEAASLTESKAKARGSTNNIIWIEESSGAATEIIGLITKNGTGEVTVPGWIKAKSKGEEVEGANPKEKSKYRIQPMMFDRRKFGVISLETGNTIEFPWELEIKSGG